MADTLDIAWAAGLFEGEGAVMLARSKCDTESPVVFLQVVVAMTDEEPVRRLSELWGGSINAQGSRHPQWKPSQRWVANSREAAAFLADIQPFVRSERMRAKIGLALEFQAQKAVRGQKGQLWGRGRRLPPEYHRRQQDFWERMRLLNLKGRDALSPAERQQVVA